MIQTRTLYIILHSRFPSEKAASLFAAKSAEAFARAGERVVLLVPRRFGTTADDPYVYYKIERNFETKYLPVVDLFPVPVLKKVAFYVSFVTFSISVLGYLIRHAHHEDVLYTNESFSLILASLFVRFRVRLYEMHDFPERKLWLYRLLLNRATHVLVTNTWKMEKLRALFPRIRAQTFVEQNAVDLTEFPVLDQQAAREKLGLPQDNKIIVYTGHLYGWKGVDTLAEAARRLSHDTLVYFVGGTDGDITSFGARYAEILNLRMAGRKLHSEIPYWQAAADVLVLPNTGKEDISKYYTSPMKLFEYMASMRPIVASDLPSVRELLSEENAVLVAPDDASALAHAIGTVLADGAQGHTIASRARADVETHTWDARAGRVLARLVESTPP